ncbi:hypothetical protein CHS0354_019432 [Potamilus streckersoni]|uniref:Uncharacterized protein n=1 Tax=Potamilus streckersoni TaxID=2493646 RepID=A0AAE0VWU0_9BIVA|nr:hypothetical protein CHS0354_019432 [Potamilus streckersoni]
MDLSTLIVSENLTIRYLHQQLKASLFETPHRGSDTNFSLDFQPDIDHRDALKAFRPSAALEAIVPRMSVIDILLSAEESVSKYSNHVYVFIKKPGSAGKLDIYNITEIIKAIDMRYNEDKLAAELPNFKEGRDLKKLGDMVEYELGPHVHYDNIEDLRIPEKDLKEALTRTRM